MEIVRKMMKCVKCQYLGVHCQIRNCFLYTPPDPNSEPLYTNHMYLPTRKQMERRRNKVMWKRIDRSELAPTKPFIITNGEKKEFRCAGDARYTTWATHWMYIEEIPGPLQPHEEIAKTRMAPQWISVNDRLPAYGQKVATLYKRYGEDNWSEYMITYCCKDKFSDNLERGKTLYWIPLPDMPK